MLASSFIANTVRGLSYGDATGLEIIRPYWDRSGEEVKMPSLEGSVDSWNEVSG